MGKIKNVSVEIPYWDEGQKKPHKWFQKRWWKRYFRKKHLKIEYKNIYKIEDDAQKGTDYDGLF